MILIDGKGAVLGRLASYAAKSALKGEEVNILNCGEIIITGNKKATQTHFEEKRSRFGHSQKGPKHPATSEKLVKRAIRGMLPDHRVGRGREAFKKIRCYVGIPQEFQDKTPISIAKKKKIKSNPVREFTKQ
ncbi:50S ribosomal protein L13 [archaeon]|jgi:large subunit ribosomal protein L13|nr:50S ribosomal protein L13 [archaeon]